VALTPSSSGKGTGIFDAMISGFGFSDLICTGERGANFGEETFRAKGGGVDIGRLEGVLPAAAFFSICRVPKESKSYIASNCLVLSNFQYPHKSSY